MILSNVLLECYDRLNFGSSPAADVTTRLTRFINSAVREVLADPILLKYRNATIPIVTVAGMSTCALQQAIADVNRIVDRGNQFELEETDQAWIRSQDPGRLVSGSTPTNYAIVGYRTQVAAQPAASEQLYVQSTSGSDTQIANIQVVNSKGYIRAMSVNLTGATPVAIGPADSVMVKAFYLASAAAGEVFLTEVSGGGNEIARIGIGYTSARYCVLEFFPQTSTAVTLYADVQLDIVDLINGTDEPIIEDEYTEAIIHLVRAREYDKREKTTLSVQARRDAQPIINRMYFHMHARRGRSGQGRPPRWSQLGPYYPPGS